ncbi:hypothetical protein CYLTODRAFT_360851 [Cylindrobasidium torrendii FP15055 ss-10]|uniref:Uncharacterized protein n=1 Tax=Cylindrobasidium torrendii FP15055 ss-10 TaxID=1314674 RepID=A0A0D7AWX2_9AGAR|nr:hypothetical protein CYLTODRAFT_360851 [Cylindrobasidium torrendii FP15055 ss-10]
MAPGPLSQKLTQIGSRWALDILRPETQFGTFLQALAKHPGLTQDTVTAAQLLERHAALKKYPLSPRMLKPASSPQYYSRLIEATEMSAQGIGRPGWKRLLGIR